MKDDGAFVSLDSNLLGTGASKLLAFLKSRVLFQDEALTQLARAYDLAQSPLRQPHTTFLQMMLVGCSGVGKTETARALAEFLFGNMLAMTKIDCGNLNERYSGSMLVGSTAGYLGYDHPTDSRYSNPPRFSQKVIDKPAFDYLMRNLKFIDPAKYSELEDISKQAKEIRKGLNGTLAPEVVTAINQQVARLEERRNNVIERAVLQHPLKQVVLLDEFEKAHPSVRNMILPILDEGRIQMANGEFTSFENALVIITSNVGSREIGESIRGKHSIGFAGHSSPSESSDIAKNSARKIFPPEFMSRMGNNIFVFNPLNRAQRRIILEQKFRQLQRFCDERFPVTISVSEEVFEFLLNLCEKNPEEGARMLEKTLHQHVTSLIGSLINSGQVDKQDRIVLSIQDNRITAVRDNSSAEYQPFGFQEAPEQSSAAPDVFNTD
jgi:ATP-dependent Clp protease ATP-binding subunit ClpA